MIFDKVGISEALYADKSLEEFTQAFKGKIRSGRIKIAYDMIPKTGKTKKAKEAKISKPKEEVSDK